MRLSVFLSALLAASAGLVGESAAVQRVYLDFTSRTTGSEHVYTLAERDAIVGMMEEDYAAFDFSFSHATTPTAPYSTLFINDGPELGEAEDIDFRNLNKSDTATIFIGDAATTSAHYITLTANVASHELGHLVGLRHHDSFGPIGSGIDPGTFSIGDASPSYPGPQLATETRYTIMETDDLFLEDEIDLFFNERSAVKLSFNERGTVVAEAAAAKGSIATAQAITLATLETPNPLESGINVGRVFDVDALAVTGRINALNEVDFYRFDGLAGDLMNFEVISLTTERITDNIDPKISLFNSAGSLVQYYSGVATNDDEFEGYDAILMDLVLPTDGTYYIRVEAFNGSEAVPAERRGNYELFLYRFASSEQILAGDYNDDGFVDAADYTVWRDAYATDSGGLIADGDGSGSIDPGDFDVWAANYGAGNIRPSAVPEPAAIVLALGAAIVSARRR
jgi:hypothetical protein